MASELQTSAQQTDDAATTATEKIPYKEFLRCADEDLLAEWVDGEVIKMSPASKKHQLIASFLAAILQFFVERKGLGVIIAAPFQVKLGPNLPGREPDLLFVARRNLDRLKETHLDGPADLVVEITGPESRARDRGEKFYEYEQAGVREYWLIDPSRKQAEFYVLGEDGIYRLVPPDANGIYQSRVLEGLKLRVEWLWQEPLPPLVTVLREWGII